MCVFVYTIYVYMYTYVSVYKKDNYIYLLITFVMPQSKSLPETTQQGGFQPTSEWGRQAEQLLCRISGSGLFTW